MNLLFRAMANIAARGLSSKLRNIFTAQNDLRAGAGARLPSTTAFGRKRLYVKHRGLSTAAYCDVESGAIGNS